MDKVQIQKELYELELRKVALESEIKQLEAEVGNFNTKKDLLWFGFAGSLAALLVPGVGPWGGGAGLAACSAMQSKYTKQVGQLGARIKQCTEERTLAERRMREFREDLREVVQKPAGASRAVSEVQTNASLKAA